MLNNRMKGAYYHTYQAKLASRANVMALIEELKNYYEVLMKLLNETNDRIDHDREVMKEKLTAIYNKLLHMQFILTKFNDEIDLAIAEKLQNLMEHFETGIVDLIQQYDCNLFNHNLFTGVEEDEELKLEDSEIYDRSIFHIGTELGFRWFGGKINSKRVMTELDNCFRLTKATNLGVKKTEDYINSNPIIELFIYGPRGMSWIEIGQNATFGYNVVVKYNSLKDNLKATIRSEDYTVPREFDTNVLDINIIFDMLYESNDNLKEDTYIKVKTNLPAASFGGIPQYFLSDAKSTSDYADAKAVKNNDARILNDNNRDVSYTKDFNDSVEDFYKKQPEVIITSQTFRHKDNKSTNKVLTDDLTSMDGVIEAKLASVDTVKISSIVKRTDKNEEFGGVDALHNGITLGELGREVYQDDEYFTNKQDLINESMLPGSNPLYNSGDQNVDLFDYRDLGTVSLIAKNENMFGVDNALHNSPVVVNNNEDYGDFKNDKGLRNKVINDSLLDVLSDNEFYEDKPTKVSEMGTISVKNGDEFIDIGFNKITGVYETSAGTFASSDNGIFKWDDNYSKFIKTNITKGKWGKIFSTPDGNVWFLSLDNDGIYKLDRTITDSNVNPQIIRTNIVTGTFTDALVTKTGDFFALCSESNHNFDPITSKYKVNSLVWVYTDGNICEYSDFLIKKYDDDSLDCVINEETAGKLTGGSYKLWYLPLIDTYYILNLKSKTLFKSAVGVFGDFSIASTSAISNYQDGYVTIDGKIQKMTADGNFSKVYTKTTTEINGLKNVVSNHVVTDMNLEDLNYNDDETDAVEIPDGTVKVLDDEMFAIPDNVSYIAKEYDETIKKTYQLIYDVIANDGTKKEEVFIEKSTPFHREEVGDNKYISDFKKRSIWLVNTLNPTIPNTSKPSGIRISQSMIFKNNKRMMSFSGGCNTYIEHAVNWVLYNNIETNCYFTKYTINNIEKNRHILTVGISLVDPIKVATWVYDKNAINYQELANDLIVKLKEKYQELISDKQFKYHYIVGDTNKLNSMAISSNFVIYGLNNFKVESITPVVTPDYYEKHLYEVVVSDDVVCCEPVFGRSGMSYQFTIKNRRFRYYINSDLSDDSDVESFAAHHIKEYDDLPSLGTDIGITINEGSANYSKFYAPTMVFDFENTSCSLYDNTFDLGDSLEEFREIIDNECFNKSQLIPVFSRYGEAGVYYETYASLSEPVFVRSIGSGDNYYEEWKGRWVTPRTKDVPFNIEDVPETVTKFYIDSGLSSKNATSEPAIVVVETKEQQEVVLNKFAYTWKEFNFDVKSKIENLHAGFEKKNYNKDIYALSKSFKMNPDEVGFYQLLCLNGNLPIKLYDKKVSLETSTAAVGPLYGSYKYEVKPNLFKPLLLSHYVSDDSDECVKYHLCEVGNYTFCNNVEAMLDENGFYGETERYKRMNYLDFFKAHGIGMTEEKANEIKKNFKARIIQQIRGTNTIIKDLNYLIQYSNLINATQLYAKGTNNLFATFYGNNTSTIFDDYQNTIAVNKIVDDEITLDGKKYYYCEIIIGNKGDDTLDGEVYANCFAAHPVLNENGEMTLEFNVEKSTNLNFCMLIESSVYTKQVNKNTNYAISSSNFIKTLFDIKVVKKDIITNDDSFYYTDDSGAKKLDGEKIVEYIVNNYGFYIPSHIIDLDAEFAEKNNDFSAYDKTQEVFEETLSESVTEPFEYRTASEEMFAFVPEKFSYSLPVLVSPNTGDLRTTLGCTTEFTVGKDRNTGGNLLTCKSELKSMTLIFALDVENGTETYQVDNATPPSLVQVPNRLVSDSPDETNYCLAPAMVDGFTTNKLYTEKDKDGDGVFEGDVVTLSPGGHLKHTDLTFSVYVPADTGSYYWHEDEPKEHYPEETFRPRVLNTPIYTEKEVKYDRPNGVIDVQYCNGYFYVLLNNDHIYKFDTNFTLVGIVNCNDAESIYVNSNVLFIQDKYGRIFTDRESIKRHPSLYKTNLFYRKKNGEVVELNTKIIAHAQDR